MTASECTECGIGDRGAFLVDVDDTTYCEDCAPARPCERCGAETTALTLSGSPRCESCQGRDRRQDTTRAAGQGSLEEWSA